MKEFNHIIKKVISEFGKNIITEVRFVNILSDYGAFESCPSYKFVIRELINAGFMGKLLTEISVNNNYSVVKFDLIYQIEQLLPIKENVLSNVFDCILYGLVANRSYETSTSTNLKSLPQESESCSLTRDYSVVTIPTRANKHWTAQEEKKLKRLYNQNYTVQQMADEMQRSTGSICGRLTNVLGYDNWTTDDTFIDERGYHVCMGVEPKQESSSFYKVKQATQPLRKGKHWTKAEEEKLQRLYNQGNNVTVIADKLGRTPLSICSRLTNIIGNKWTTNDTCIDERGYHVLIDYLQM